MPRYISSMGINCPKKATLDRNCEEYRIINPTDTSMPITLHTEGFDYILDSGDMISSVEMFDIALSGNTIISKSYVTLTLCGKRRPDSLQEYSALLTVSSGIYNETIEILITDVEDEAIPKTDIVDQIMAWLESDFFGYQVWEGIFMVFILLASFQVFLWKFKKEEN